MRDWYGHDYYQQRPDPDCDPQGPNTRQYKVLRGGSWNHDPWLSRVSMRVREKLTYRFDRLRFSLRPVGESNVSGSLEFCLVLGLSPESTALSQNFANGLLMELAKTP